MQPSGSCKLVVRQLLGINKARLWLSSTYMVGIICPLPPGWNRVKVAAKNLLWTCPHAHRPAFVRQLSGSCQAVVRQLSGSCQAVVRQSSGSSKAVLRQSSSSHPAVMRLQYLSFIVQSLRWMLDQIKQMKSVSFKNYAIVDFIA